MKVAVCAVFDVGKTNKKLFLFDQNYQIVYEESVSLPETIDEDGDPCEDLEKLSEWITDSFQAIKTLESFDIKAVNFSAYGASFVHVAADGKPVAPLYNYLKPYPPALQKQFYETHGGEENFATATASPVLGSLNSGMQLYRLKHEKPALFAQIKHSLHLPQYLSFLITGQAYTDFTSVGCHTNLWNFSKSQYHDWILAEKIAEKFAPFQEADCPIDTQNMSIGVGLHDSSSAIIPYTLGFPEPFLLLSTGTWNISLNPFNNTELTFEELQSDCLCYLTHQAKPVKAARLFAGNTHEIQTKRLAKHFNMSVDAYKDMTFDKSIIDQINDSLPFDKRDLSVFSTYEVAYHELVFDIVQLQIASTKMVIHNSPVKKIFVDGGFSKNPIFMNLLAEAFPKIEVYAAEVSQATALGAAVVLHKSWNTKPLPKNIITLKHHQNAQL